MTNDIETLIEGLPVDDLGPLDYLDSEYVTQDVEVAYNSGRDAGPDDDCPFEDREARQEWERGRDEADNRDVYSMSRGYAPDRYRDPGRL